MKPKRKIKRHQSTPACARCSKLKQKCDRGTPRCSRCVAAGTECMAISRGTSTQIPRSLVLYLEQRLAELQQKTDKPRQHEQPGVDRHSHSLNSRTHAQITGLTTLSIRSRFTSSLFRSGDQLQHHAKLFYPSERPPLKIPVLGVYHDVERRTAGRAYADQSSHFKPRNIPIHVATRLFRNYNDEILPRFPCFFEDDLDALYNQFYDTVENRDSAPELSGFVIPMTLALGALTSSSQDVSKVAALSESLYADAMRHAGLLKDSSIYSLQCLLLLIQLALLLPYTCNASYMTGEAIRMAICLGLHQEPEPDDINDAKQVELRRRVFWTTYQLDRTVAISAGCPIAISDEHITTKLPYNGGEIHSPSIELNRLDVDNLKEFQFLIHTRVRSIQSQIQGVQFFDQDTPRSAPDYQSWVSITATLIDDLVKQVPADGASRTWLAIAAQQCQVMLYRPCSRNIAVSDDSLVACVQASIQLNMSHATAVQAGGFVVAFEIANSAFHAGMILLYALRNHSNVLKQTRLEHAAQESLNGLPVLLDKMAIRWPAISDTAYYIRELTESCLRNPVGYSGNIYDISLLEELDCLVTQRRVHTLQHRNIPLPPHRGGARPQCDTASQASEGFLDDEEWWRAFIRDESEMAGDGVSRSTPTYFPAITTISQTTAIPSTANSPYLPARREAQGGSISTEIDELLNALPSCSYCRDRRIKCHQQIPACKECQRTSRVCVVFDPVLGDNVSLSRLGCLIDDIKAAEINVKNTAAFAPCREPSTPSHVLLSLTSNDRSIGSEHAVLFGQWSSVGLLWRSIAQTARFELPRSIREAIQSSAHGLDPEPNSNADLPPIATAEGLCKVFARTTNVFYKVLDDSQLDDLLSQCYAPDRGAQQTQEPDILYLVFAIASLVGKRSDPSFAAQSEAYFEKAKLAMGTTCDHSSRQANIILLQRTVLICIYLHLSPGSGDIWRHLGFAIRLFLDLSHRPSLEDDKYQAILCTLTRTLYTLESQVSIALGRPSLLNIGDNLREDLTKAEAENTEERIAILSYLIAFQKMQIHKALLGRDAGSEEHTGIGDLSKDGPSNYCYALDEWFLRWTEFISSLPDDESKANLTSWGLFNYHQGLFILSLLRQRPVGVPTLTAIVNAGLHLHHHQQLFSRLCATAWVQKPPISFPMTWTTSHAILQVWLQTYITNTFTKGRREHLDGALDRLSSLLMVLEVDPDNVLSGISLTLDALRGQISEAGGDN